MKAFVLFLALIGVASALRCYQGQQKSSIPAEDSPMECPANSASCTLTLVGETNTVARPVRYRTARHVLILLDIVDQQGHSHLWQRSVTEMGST